MNRLGPRDVSSAEWAFKGIDTIGVRHLTSVELEAGLDEIRQSPKDGHLIHDEGSIPMSKSRMDALFFFGAPHLQKELVQKSALR